MWIVSGALSILFCILGWVLACKKNLKAIWSIITSFIFVSITLLLEYRLVFNWVNLGDWSALLDVVPSMFLILTCYVIILSLANIMAIVYIHKELR